MLAPPLLLPLLCLLLAEGISDLDALGARPQPADCLSELGLGSGCCAATTPDEPSATAS